MKTTPAPIGPKVNTSFGMLEGMYYMKNHALEVFLGVPFAQPPVGKLRFKPPMDPMKWKGVKEARMFSDLCMQKTDYTTGKNRNTSEDCLYLNVFVDKKASEKAGSLMPVMMFIHGGGYIQGGASMYPVDGILENLASRGVIVVTTNYRLNLFGFMTSNTSALPANLGLRDQIKALQWIKKEIKAFGGDPMNVTIFGESAGSSSVSILTYSPLGKGLFHKAIMESGTAYAPWALDGNTGVFSNASRDLAVKTGCVSAADWMNGKISAVPDCLRKISAKKLTEMGNDSHWVPRVDGKGGVLPDWPANLAKSRVPNMPVILGTNHDESALNWILDLMLGEITEKNFTMHRLEREINRTVTQGQFGMYTEKVRDLVRFVYMGARTPLNSTDYLQWFMRTVQMMSGNSMFAPTSKEAHMLHVPGGNKNVYLYSFDYLSDAFPWPNTTTHMPIKAVFHSMDLFFIFKTFWQEIAPIPWKFSKNDMSLSQQFGQMWTDFAKTGVPSKSWTPLRFPKFNKTMMNRGVAYSINLKSKMVDDYERLATRLWNELVPEITGGQEGPTPEPTPAPTGLYGKGYFVATWLLLAVVVISVAIIVIMIMKHHRDNNNPYGTL